MRPKRALVCALMPQFDRDSGSRRVFDLITFLQEAGWDVTFVAQHVKHDPRYRRILQQRGVAVYIGANTWIEPLVSAVHFDLAVFGLWHVAEPHIPILRQLSPETPILVDSIDLHFLRQARRLFVEGDRSNPVDQLDSAYGDEMRRELNTYAAADGVIAISRKEADLLGDFLGDRTRTFVMPDNEDLPPSPYPFAERRGMLFVGYLRYAPNVGAVEYLCRDILPRLEPALLAEHPAYIVGDGVTEDLLRWAHQLPPVKMVGWVPSIGPYLHRARISVVPLLYGAGTKRKLVQALMSGTPSVSTRIGAEGLNLRAGEHALIADDPAAFAGAITQLLRDEALWRRLAVQGREHVLQTHGREVVRAGLLEAIAEMLHQTPKSQVARPANPAESSGLEGGPAAGTE